MVRYLRSGGEARRATLASNPAAAVSRSRFPGHYSPHTEVVRSAELNPLCFARWVFPVGKRLAGGIPLAPRHAARGARVMARPKLTPDELRTHRIQLYLSPSELRMLRSRAAAWQMSVPAYLRGSALHLRFRDSPPRRLGADEFYHLSRIGANINQIARSLNQGLEAPGLSREDLQQLRELLSSLMPESDDS